MVYNTGRERKFFNALQKGSSVSRKQATARYGLLNPSAAILRFEDAGYAISRDYTTKVTKIQGAKVATTTVKYSMD